MAETLRILFIEDNLDDFNLIVMALQEAGLKFEWERVQSGTELSLALRRSFDIILADYSLPSFNAPQALTIRDKINPDIPFIVVTGSISEEVAVECMKLGAHDYVLKDRLPRLATAIHNAIDDRNNQQAKIIAEQALRRSEQRARTMFQESLDVILILDAFNGYILDVNRAVERILQHRPEDLINQSFSRLFQTSRHLSAKDMLAHLRLHDGVLISQSVLRADQSICPMDLTTTLIPWDDGSSAIMLTLRDVSEREQRDAERHAAESLRIELEKERDVNELKSRFISITSHEFRTPLTIISSSNQLLDRFRDRLSEERRLTLHHQIEAQVRYMTTLLEDVLTVGQMQRGTVALILEEFEFNDYIENLIRELSSTYSNRRIEVKPAPEEIMIQADKKLMRQLTSNLIVNALKYSSPEEAVVVEIKPLPDQFELRVIDQGIGIPESDQKHLFQTFFRASNVGSTNGTGLGLSIVYWAVEQHQGTINVRSIPGKGSVFTVVLPRYAMKKA